MGLFHRPAETMWTLTFLVVLSLALGIGAWLFFIWSVKSGQYDDVEGPKHRMLDDDDDEPRDGSK
jgi:cbb3-type cytochrome oxidase maturation protein